MAYEEEHRGALAEVRSAGASVTFRQNDPGTHDPETETWTDGGYYTVEGYAMQVDGDPREYERLGLVETEAPTLLFVATTFGEAPALGATCEWGERKHTVRSVRPFAPAGSAIFAYVVVQR